MASTTQLSQSQRALLRKTIAFLLFLYGYIVLINLKGEFMPKRGYAGKNFYMSCHASRKHFVFPIKQIVFSITEFYNFRHHNTMYRYKFWL